MDDAVYVPEEGGRYRIAFAADGSVSVEAGCNQASGELSLFDPPRLQFATLAATLQLCEPGSISGRFLKELQWVRSYVYQDGHLHLATMADGSIITFAPLPKREAAATVAGLTLVSEDPDTLRSVILGRLLGAYAVESGIGVSDAEIERYLKQMDQTLKNDLGDRYTDPSTLSPEEQQEALSMRQRMANALIRGWKINRSLYEKYGGRVVYQQMGLEPLDAYRQFLEDAQSMGRFSIREAELEAAFWSVFSDEQRHDFMPEDSARQAFDKPIWEQD
jgi:hypothetical protein